MDRRRTEGGKKWTDLTCSLSFFTSSLLCSAFFLRVSQPWFVSELWERRRDTRGRRGRTEKSPSNQSQTNSQKIRMHYGKSGVPHTKTATERWCKLPKKKCPANISMLDIYMSKSVAGCAATSSSVNTLMNYMHFGYSTMQTPLSAL